MKPEACELVPYGAKCSLTPVHVQGLLPTKQKKELMLTGRERGDGVRAQTSD